MNTTDAIPTPHRMEEVERAVHFDDLDQTRDDLERGRSDDPLDTDWSKSWVSLQNASLLMGVSRLHVWVMARDGEIDSQLTEDGTPTFRLSHVHAMKEASRSVKNAFACAAAKHEELRAAAALRYA